MRAQNIISLSAMAIMMVTAVSCSQEPIVEVNPVVEQYTQNFIKQFGIPASGHDFAMATSAGLRVKTANGGHVTVTAEVDGKEYLFADLNVPAGTHALPVTIPNSVTTLKIKSGFKTLEAGVNDLIDIDDDTPSSRGVNISAPNDFGIFTFTDNDDDAPLITFSPDDFLNEYLNNHKKGEDCTNKWYLGKDVDKGYIDPWANDSIYVYYGEVGLGATDLKYNAEQGWYVEGLHYIIFPVWWNTNRYGDKDYRLSMVQYNAANNSHAVPFNDAENGEIPFPQLGYSESVIDPENVMANINSFIYDDGTFNKAYDPVVAKTVVSKGVKVDMEPDSWDESAFRLDLRSGIGETYSFSSTVPYWNAKVWGNKYYDVTISDLMYSTVSTMLYILEGQKFEVNNYPLNNNTGHTDPKYCDSPFLIGFTSQPKCEADTDPRDYTDLILLVLPTHGLELLYNINDLPEPYVWTMAIEDLGGTDDWDFNDVVFHFTDVIRNLNSVNGNKIVTYWSGSKAAESVRTIDVWPVATGGTMPIYITFNGTVSGMSSIPLPEWGNQMFSDANKAIKDALQTSETGTFVLGTEVHKWLGAQHYTQFVNVGASRDGSYGKHVQFVIPATTDLSYTNKMGAVSEQNKPLYGFSLLVDRENTLGIDALNNEEKGMSLLPDLKLGEGTYLIGAPNENGSVAPQMLLISDGDGSWQWPTERTKISDAYPDFNDWISNTGNSAWHKNPKEGKVTKK